MAELDIDQLLQFQRDNEKLKAEKERATGKLEQLKAQLKERWGCDTKGAMKLLKEKQKLRDSLAAQVQEGMAKYRQEWPGV